MIRLVRGTSSSLLRSRCCKRAMSTGIHKMDLYFPNHYVSQKDLEVFDGVGSGKYTKGLGLKNMAFCDDNEDINSVCLTALNSFLKKNGLNPRDIGRLEVGTETLVDKSKAVKTVLMQLFEASGNTDIEGVDNINACYGGTAALLNTVAWVNSPESRGRYGIVVCGDIATYEPGPARPTGGAAVAVMLVGKDAPLQIESGLRASYFEHAFDFYKPKMSSEWPVVDGQHSVLCYLRALDKCYENYQLRFSERYGRDFDVNGDAFKMLFHTPFVKMTKKAFTRIVLNEIQKNPSKFAPQVVSLVNSTDLEKGSKELDAALDEAGSLLYETLVQSTTRMSSELGNSYTASLYATLAGTLIDHDCADKRLVMFSYGSGLAATMFSFVGTDKVASVIDAADVQGRLASRVQASPEEFTAALARRQQVAVSWSPASSESKLAPGTFYLKNIDDMYRRSYACK